MQLFIWLSIRIHITARATLVSLCSIYRCRVYNLVWKLYIINSAAGGNCSALLPQSYSKGVGACPLIFHWCLRLAVWQAFYSDGCCWRCSESKKIGMSYRGGSQTSHLWNPADKHSSISLVLDDNVAVFASCYITLHLIYKRRCATSLWKQHNESNKGFSCHCVILP